jgi:hypothetical protein
MPPAFERHLSCVCFGALVVSIACVISGCHHRPDQAGFSDLSFRPAVAVVQLRCAKIPGVSAIASHCWFAEFDRSAKRWRRWEVWQNAGKGPGSWGHIRRDLMGPANGVGHGDSWVLAEWTGAEADRLTAVLREPTRYPWPNTYRYWPGPNSNTYVAWVLREAGVSAGLPWGAIGRWYCIFG